MSHIHTLLERLWENYCTINPQATAIHQLLEARGETVHNDHIAFRTFQHPKIGIDQIAVPFVEAGYMAAGDYHFEEKKLNARHFEHDDPNLPKVFISELLTNQFSSDLQTSVATLIDQIPDDFAQPICAAGRPWSVSIDAYRELQTESEYAAWMSAHGFCANHFTVSVNHLKSIDSVGSLNQILRDAGFKLNEQGGAAKGSPDVFLEQSSTVASKVVVDFSDGQCEVPGCYYEFAKRYPMPDGNLFGGFVTKSADKIFESTDTRLQND